MIHDLAAALVGSERGGAARRVLREAVWFLWEAPRLPKPLLDAKYPLAYPWSPRAREVAQAGSRPPGGWGLVIEHAVPRTILVTTLLTDPTTREPAQTLALLVGGTRAAVITRDDDALLNAAGLRHQMPERADPGDGWARYRAAGLDPAMFSPLAGRPGV